MAKRSFNGSIKPRSRSIKRRALSARGVSVLSGGTRGVKKGRSQIGKGVALERRITRAILDMKEPKYVLESYTGQTVGQVNVNASGHNSNLLNTVTPSQGDSVSQRDGNQIIGKYFKMGVTMWQQSAATFDQKVKFFLVRQMGDAPVFTVGELFRSNQAQSDLNGAAIYDNTCMRNPIYMDTYDIVGSQEVDLKSTPKGNIQAVQQFDLYFNLDNQLIQFSDSTASPKNVTYTLLATCSGGNKNTLTPSTLLGTPVLPIDTGVFYNYTCKLAFRDI